MIKHKLPYSQIDEMYEQRANEFVKELWLRGIKVEDYTYNPFLGYIEFKCETEEDELMFMLLYK